MATATLKGTERNQYSIELRSNSYFILDSAGNSLCKCDSESEAESHIRDVLIPEGVLHNERIEKSDAANDGEIIRETAGDLLPFDFQSGPLHGRVIALPRAYCQRWADICGCSFNGDPVTKFTHRSGVGEVTVVHRYELDWNNRTAAYAGIDEICSACDSFE